VTSVGYTPSQIPTILQELAETMKPAKDSRFAEQKYQKICLFGTNMLLL